MVNQVTLNVQGMSCGHCVSSVEGSVGKLDGVNEVKVDLESGKVDVSFDEDKVSLDVIKETIDDQGYDVN
ncbi:copper chaperone [Paenisporosarcina quisquiliarum]|jgi:copper chaperone|uniref:Copper chaperone CopZ n=1 Tax=Psychrobacillus psychrodurans TaxID=126157 RepID=A0A9X3LCB0_9BACI|nr:copper chaperone CopZ [Psychrobacillus psychrodurans]SEM96330.1 copper chaperone [Paenisporosarcina quisquiliarum]MCK1997401.1 copper chaperone CopZ [Psychrobacillus psychrodurans]MCZ8534619.1 copper chaperone CopZ [Psychrobacillus psychrodurans]MCZ8541740.1 copper chaperone CopZ [Psychrobacillus psychrodurans]SFN08038.1 copper chaperone [Psychrobacillus psychrodurans]